MTPTTNLVLGVAFAVVGICAAVLQYWLWTFPMVPDPSGRDPNGQTTAPKAWRMFHRVLGYAFAILYGALLIQMIPRLPFLGESESGVVVWLHAVLGLAILPVLVFKVGIIRVWQKFGKALPIVGGGIALAALILIGAVFAPASDLARWPAATPEDRQAKAIIESRCFSCHGASVILNSDDKEWGDVLEEMSEIARGSGRPDPVGSDRVVLLRYLSRVILKEGDDD